MISNGSSYIRNIGRRLSPTHGTSTNILFNEIPNNRIYFRYVEYILLIYNQNKTIIEETLAEFNKRRTNIKFTTEKEQHNSIHFLDHTIHQKRTKLQITIYRKSTQTGIVIPNDSCHPHEHKMSSVNYLMNRMLTYPVTKEAKEKELNIIPNILHNNRYNKNLSTRNSKQHKTQQKYR